MRFRDTCNKAGICAAITPSILPIENWPEIRRFAKACKTHFLEALGKSFSKTQRGGRQYLLATAVCSELCSQLIDEGSDRMHFYKLYRPHLTRDICHALGATTPAKLEKFLNTPKDNPSVNYAQLTRLSNQQNV